MPRMGAFAKIGDEQSGAMPSQEFRRSWLLPIDEKTDGMTHSSREGHKNNKKSRTCLSRHINNMVVLFKETQVSSKKMSKHKGTPIQIGGSEASAVKQPTIEGHIQMQYVTESDKDKTNGITPERLRESVKI